MNPDAHRAQTPPGIERLLRPRSVAILGASATPGALGTAVIANLDRRGYRGALHLINPKRREIGGRMCLESVEQLPEGVDAAVLAIPQAAVLPALEGLARRRVGAAVIFSAGFAEGGSEGQRLQAEIARIARASGLIVEGPNCLGFVNNVDGVALTFVETPAAELGQAAGIGIVSQSGAMAAVLGVSLVSRGLGISYSVSTGNEAVSGVEDFLAFLIEDARTMVLGLIVEQFRDPQRFLALARRSAQIGKRIVLLHPGRSAAARQSAATHTGAMAGDYELMRTLVAHHGVILARSLEELGDVLELCIRCAVRPEAGPLVVTESGAFKALTLDLCEEQQLVLACATDQDCPALRRAIPPFVPVSNPIDITAQGLVEPDIFRRVLAGALEDGRFGTVVFTIIQTDHATSSIKFPPIIEAIRALQPRRAVIVAGMDEGAAVPQAFIEQLRALGVPYFPSAERCLRALARLLAASGRTGIEAGEAPLRLGWTPAETGTVPEYRSKELLRPLGIPFPPARLVRSCAEALEAAAGLGYPVVLKAQAAGLAHKSDAGGVILNLADSDAVAEGWRRLQDNMARNRPDLRLDGVLVERMSEPGLEFIIGGRRDPDWGPIVLVGLGGVQAELLRDVRLLPADLTEPAVIRELDRLRGSGLLRGFRGSPALDVDALAGLITRVGRVLLGEPRLREIDLNPVIVYPGGRGVLALDALLIAEAAD